MHALTPKTRQEAVAVFRHGVIGALTQAQMDRGQLRAALKQLARQRFRPPGAKATRSYSESTLERWYSALSLFMRSYPRQYSPSRSWSGVGRKRWSA